MLYTRCEEDTIPLVGNNSLSIKTLRVEFPESSDRAGFLLSNGLHNIPVRVCFKIIDKANNNKDVSRQYKHFIHLYDLSINRGIFNGYHKLLGEDSENLIISLQHGPYTWGIYGKSTISSAPRGSSGLTEQVFYLNTSKPLTAMKDYKICAYLALHGEVTPGDKMVSSGNKKSVNLTVLPPTITTPTPASG